MPKYIDRDAFKNEYLCWGYLPEMSEEEFDAFPAADVEPVRHGRWIQPTGCGSPFCSACSKPAAKTFFGGCFTPAYCPNCGSNMDMKS